MAEFPDDDDDLPDDDEERRQSVDTLEKKKVEKARKFNVVFHNDDYTTQEFVVRCLIKFFQKTETEANQLMLSVHFKGRAVVGVYPRDVAETKVAQTMDFAKEKGQPLLVTSEPE